MAFTIYTVSDPATVGSAISAMAMFFGQDDWIASLVKTGLMLSLIFILAQGVTRNGLRLDVMVVQLIVVWAMFMPKTTVTVEQFDNAAPPRVVDDVPYAIALPASLAGAFALYMTNKIEAVMVNVDGDYLSVSGDTHPFTPARTLMAITMCPSDPMMCADQNLVESMRLAARYCAGGGLAKTKFNQSPDVLKSFADTLTEVAQTIVYDDNNPYIPGGNGGRSVSCAQAQAHFIAISEAEKNGVGKISEAMNGLANRAEIKKYSSSARAEDGTIKNWDDALTGINKLRDANSKMDSLAFANVTLYSLADTMKTSANAPIDQAINIRRDTGLFEWAKAEAQQSMLVSTTAPKFMDILFFIFIASTPIVMFIVAANPQGGLKVAGSYALFGMWTQSWIPMMAIIMSWYQTEIRNIVSPVNNAITPEYTAFFMRHAYTTTIAASNMIQQAPYLMFAIMTGSMFALSGMVSKAMPSGKGGEGGALKPGGGGGGGGGSDVLNPGGAKGAIPGAGMAHAIHGGQMALQQGSTSGNVGMVGDVSAAVPGMAELNASGDIKTGSAYQSKQSAAARQQIQTQSQQAATELSQLVDSAAKKMGGAKVAQIMTDAGVKTSFDAKTGKLSNAYGTFDVGSGQSNTTGQSTEAKIALQADSNKSMIGKLVAAGTGVSLAGSIAGAVGDAVKQEVKAGNGRGIRTDQSAGTTDSTTVTGGSTAGNGVTGTNGAEYTNMASTAKSLQTTFSKLASDTQALDKADSATQDAGTTSGTTVGRKTDGGVVATNWGSQVSRHFQSATGNDGEALNRVQGLATSALTPEQQAAFRQQAAAEMQRMDKAGQTTNLGRDQVAMAAAWTTLANMAASASTPHEKISAQLGMAQLSKAAGGPDMTAGLQAVKDGLQTVAAVNANLAAMEQTVKPAVEQAKQEAGAKLNPQAQQTFQESVAAQKAAHKGQALSLQNHANGGLQSVQEAGAKQKADSLAAIGKATEGILDMKPLVQATETQRENQSALPQRNDISQFAAGNNTSLNHKLFGTPEEGKKTDNVGAQGSGGVIPPQTLAGALGPVVQSGQQLAGQAVEMFSQYRASADGVVNKAVDHGMAAAPTAPHGSSSSPSQGSTTVVNQNNGSGGTGLPNMGIAGGASAPQSGGGSNVAPPPPATPSAKPYASANAAKNDKGGKPKTGIAKR